MNLLTIEQLTELVETTEHDFSASRPCPATTLRSPHLISVAGSTVKRTLPGRPAGRGWTNSPSGRKKAGHAGEFASSMTHPAITSDTPATGGTATT